MWIQNPMASEDATLIAEVEAPSSDRGLPHTQIASVETLGVMHPFNTLHTGMEGVTRSAMVASHPPLSFVAGPTLTAGSASSSGGMSTSTAFVPVPIPGVIEPAFAQPTAFATPLVYPSTLTTAYYPAAAAAPSPTPCTFLTAGPSITAVCHCVYAQPCALHHRPITYAHAPHSFPTIAGSIGHTRLPAPTHSHALPNPSTAASVQVPTLPPTLAPQPMRSSAMRLKRPATLSLGQSNDSEPCALVRQPKLRRVASLEGESSTSVVSPAVIASGEDDGVVDTSSANNTVCGECRNRAAAASAPCTCHQHCPQHSCICSRTTGEAVRRENEINPMHDLLLSSRMAQIERERQANNVWFHRQPLAAGGLVGVDVVTRRITPHPLVMFPRYHHPLMELSMVLLQPHETTVVVGGAAPPAAEPLPVGASVEQIQRFSTLHKYVKKGDVPENEQERCTVCLMDFESDEEVRSLRCSHVFHVACIDRWLIYNKKCPVCRLDLDKTEVVPAPN